MQGGREGGKNAGKCGRWSEEEGAWRWQQLVQQRALLFQGHLLTHQWLCQAHIPAAPVSGEAGAAGCLSEGKREMGGQLRTN